MQRTFFLSFFGVSWGISSTIERDHACLKPPIIKQHPHVDLLFSFWNTGPCHLSLRTSSVSCQLHNTLMFFQSYIQPTEAKKHSLTPVVAGLDPKLSTTKVVNGFAFKSLLRRPAFQRHFIPQPLFCHWVLLFSTGCLVHSLTLSGAGLSHWTPLQVSLLFPDLSLSVRGFLVLLLGPAN